MITLKKIYVNVNFVSCNANFWNSYYFYNKNLQNTNFKILNLTLKFLNVINNTIFNKIMLVYVYYTTIKITIKIVLI